MRYALCEGHEPEDAEQALVGPVLANALRLQGVAMLHASAVVVGGRAVAISAPSGFGKSTLATALTRAGATLLGDDVLPLERAVDIYLALPYLPRLKLWADSLERLGRGESRERVAGLLERLDLADDADRPFFELSTGMRQRLAIARALLKRPRVLLMDEPTRSVDAVHAAEMWPLVRSEIEEREGCAILVTHFAQDAVAQCSRVASLEDGRLREWTASEAPPAQREGLQLTVTVRDLRPEVVEALRGLPGVTSLSLREASGAEQVIDVAAEDGRLSLASFVDLIGRSGASVRSLEQTSGIEAAAAPGIARREVVRSPAGTAQR